jgi:hypothetical protein
LLEVYLVGIVSNVSNQEKRKSDLSISSAQRLNEFSLNN